MAKSNRSTLKKPRPAGSVRCDHCLESVAVVRLSATDLDGVLLDSQLVCRPCAVKADFEVGK
jgi:formylmethanofuran dehydrogenase subunit E